MFDTAAHFPEFEIPCPLTITNCEICNLTKTKRNKFGLRQANTCANLTRCSGVIFCQEISVLIRISSADLFAVGHLAKPPVTMHGGARKLSYFLVCFRYLVPHLANSVRSNQHHPYTAETKLLLLPETDLALES